MVSLFFLVLLLPCVVAVPTLDVNVQLGKFAGQRTSKGVTRYSLKYATAERWSPPIMSTTWSSNISNPTALPLPCPQTGLDPSQYTEDCLDLVLYVPPLAEATPEGVPTIVWIHGGSFIAGSATDPGLDGSNLAVATNAIIAVVQYRLGVLGLLPPSPSSTTNNLAIQDVMTALTFLRNVLPSFGGSPSTPNLTLAGQSSGASLIRALLAMPEAASLFSSAWLHSDPFDYGFLTPSALSTLRTAWLSELGCASSNGCAQHMDLSTLLSHQSTLFNVSPTLGPEFFPFEPLRPSTTGEFMSYPFSQRRESPSPYEHKPLVLSTVRDEATATIYSTFPDPLPASDFEPAVASFVGTNRTESILSKHFYLTNASDARVPLQILGTDMIWRCAAWRFARKLSPNHAFVGVFTRGTTYPGNELCIPLGAVCHKDDIMVVFGTGGQESADVQALTQEVQSRYAAFVRSGSPNAPGLAKWHPAGTEDVHPRVLYGARTDTDEYPVGACDPEFWGKLVPFDYQLLGE